MIEDGIDREAGDGIDACLAGYVFAVSDYGVDGDEQVIGYFFVGLAVGHGCEDFLLALGKHFRVV